jgi:hypothetical protein
MCFVLYVASRTKPKLIAWNKDAPSLCTQELGNHEKPVLKKFSLPIVTYVGSDQGCGCGFRHTDYEMDVSDAEEDTQHNHQALVRLLQEQFADESFVELYGCWSGDESLAVKINSELLLDQIGDRLFCFRERGFYRAAIPK